MKERVSVFLGCVYVGGAVYYGSTSAYALWAGNGDSRESITLILAAIWIALGGLGLTRGRRWGWWSLMTFLLLTTGAHLNRLVAQRPPMTDLGPLEPMLWAAAHVGVLAWLGDHGVKRDAVLTSQRVTAA